MDCLPCVVIGALQVIWVLPAEEDVMTRLNNTLTMQTSTSYQQIPSFHSKVHCADAQNVDTTGEHTNFWTTVLQRPEQDTLKAKVRQLARLQHLSVSALTASANPSSQLVTGLLVCAPLPSKVSCSPCICPQLSLQAPQYS